MVDRSVDLYLLSLPTTFMLVIEITSNVHNIPPHFYRGDVSRYFQRWQAVQIVKAEIPEKDIEFERRLSRIISLNQSESVFARYSCALVGNAGVLLDSFCGHVIDKFPYVIRMNLAPHGGKYASDVGSKVDLMAINLSQIRDLISCTDRSRRAVHDFASLNQSCEATETQCQNAQVKKSAPRDTSKDKCIDFINSLRPLDGKTLWVFKRLKSGLTELKYAVDVLRNDYHIHLSLAYSPAHLMQASTRWGNANFTTFMHLFYSDYALICLCIVSRIFS